MNVCECGEKEHPDWCPKSERFSFAARTLQQMRFKLQGGKVWLIECGPLHAGTRYYCGEPGDWCDNPNRAHRYETEGGARNVSERLTTIDERRVVSHVW